MSRATVTRSKHKQADRMALKRIGLRIHQDLYKLEKPVEWLAFKVGVARSSIREIIAGRSNPRILTLDAISRGLGYQTLVDFLSRASSGEP